MKPQAGRLLCLVLAGGLAGAISSSARVTLYWTATDASARLVHASSTLINFPSRSLAMTLTHLIAGGVSHLFFRARTTLLPQSEVETQLGRRIRQTGAKTRNQASIDKLKWRQRHL